MFVWLVSPDSSVDPALDCGYRSVFYAELGSTSVERYPFYRGGSAEISIEFSRKTRYRV